MSKSLTFEYKIIRKKGKRGVKVVFERRDYISVYAGQSMPLFVIESFLYAKKSLIQRKWEIFRENTIFIEDLVENAEFVSLQSCRARAKKLLKTKVEEWNKYYGFEYNRIVVRDNKTRWGSCSSLRNLNFHYKLLFLPEELQDYVVVHELCHLQEMNHSNRFWNLVGSTLPDYKLQRRELKRYFL